MQNQILIRRSPAGLYPKDSFGGIEVIVKDVSLGHNEGDNHKAIDLLRLAYEKAQTEGIQDIYFLLSDKNEHKVLCSDFENLGDFLIAAHSLCYMGSILQHKPINKGFNF